MSRGENPWERGRLTRGRLKAPQTAVHREARPEPASANLLDGAEREVFNQKRSAKSVQRRDPVEVDKNDDQEDDRYKGFNGT